MRQLERSETSVGKDEGVHCIKLIDIFDIPAEYCF